MALAMYAAIAARSGVLVEFNAKSEALVTKYDENGNAKYADGVYLPGENKIVINPEGTRSAPRALIHEYRQERIIQTRF